MVEPNNSGAKLASRNLAVTLADLSGRGSGLLHCTKKAALISGCDGKTYHDR
jgi:hypothetical protein